jgi:hypothetical protein
MCREAIARHIAVQRAGQNAVFVDRQCGDDRAEFFQVQPGVGAPHRVERPGHGVMTGAERLVSLDHFDVPADVGRAAHVLTHAEHVRDQRPGRGTESDDEPEPPFGGEPERGIIGGEDSAAGVGHDRQDVRGHEQLGRHAPGERLQRAEEIQWVDRNLPPIDEIERRYLSVLPGDRHHDHRTGADRRFDPAFAVGFETKPRRMQRFDRRGALG